jgi:hypothetical protein
MIETTLKALTERVGDLGKGVDQASAVARQADRQATIANEEVAHTRAEQEADRGVRLAVVAAALRDTVARGAPFSAELAAVKPLVRDASQLAPLEPFAATGVPNAAALARELAGTIPAMRARAAPPSRGDGIIDRLQASAERLVRIRPINAPGHDPEAVLTRIEARAAQNDINGVLGELAQLPADVRAPAAAWIKQAETRGAALAAADKLAREAFAALGKDVGR